ncbi:MAG TPA: CPBP family glutamic-type intramembrane protease [Myxococcales bacterium]|nr:CPBP family glutamic-type intramembrane protease [Myxococcales bacterium]
MLLALFIAAIPAPNQPGSHEAWLRQIQSARAREFNAALQSFDIYLRAHPSDALTAIERCRLIGATESEDGDPIDPGAEPFDECLRKLEGAFPSSGAVAAYAMDSKWGEKAVAFARSVLADPQVVLSDAERAHVLGRLAVTESSRDSVAAAQHAGQAMRLDPSIDLTAVLGKALLAHGRKAEAVAVLSSRPQGTPYELQEKARGLADAGAFFRAQWMMRKALARPGFAGDASLRGRIAEGTGKLDDAREAYRNGRGEWNDGEARLRLFRLTLEASDAAVANRAYQELRDRGFMADPLARRRIALQWKFPRTPLRARDLAGLAALLGVLAGVALLPLLALLPFHAFVLWRRLQDPAPRPGDPRAWWFRHFYLAGALLLVAQVLCVYVFAYDDLGALLTPLKSAGATAPAMARFMVVYAASAALGLVLLLLRRGRLRVLGPGSWTLRRCVGQALIALLLAKIVGLVAMRATPASLGINAIVKSLVEGYGTGVALLAVAVLIPIAEEIAFRSILLEVLSREMRFWLANLVQASLFTALHADPSASVFYLAFGLLAGRMARASGGLFAGILFHAANNAGAVLLLAALPASGLPGRFTPAAPDPGLVACAMRTAERGSHSLNDLAWSVAIDPAASGSCLARAEEAVGEALRQFPDLPGYLDTKATVLYRQGRIDEAIDLERAAAAKGPRALMFAQLERFLRARQAGGEPVVLGDLSGAGATLSTEDGGAALLVRLEEPLADGFVLFARRKGDSAVLRVAAGPQHESSYRVPLPRGGPESAGFELALLDARGCEECAPRSWRYEFEEHEAAVDKYP